YLRSIKGDESITVELLSDTDDVLDTRSWVATSDMYVETDAKGTALVGLLPVPTKPGDAVTDFFAMAVAEADTSGIGQWAGVAASCAIGAWWSCWRARGRLEVAR